MADDGLPNVTGVTGVSVGPVSDHQNAKRSSLIVLSGSDKKGKRYEIVIPVTQLRRRMLISCLTAVLGFAFFVLILLFDQLLWLAPIGLLVGIGYTGFAIWCAREFISGQRLPLPPATKDV